MTTLIVASPLVILASAGVFVAMRRGFRPFSSAPLRVSARPAVGVASVRPAVDNNVRSHGRRWLDLDQYKASHRAAGRATRRQEREIRARRTVGVGAHRRPIGWLALDRQLTRPSERVTGGAR
ncbi:hypothetical protein GCM10010399_43900 [Dactylosporangium fulvum]|uniref:Secreted protein n=1 Tax=Dactylosporangium fulvum TaxID=53359 RepID=A0ABY5W788_9ACTN|nr:hypothetical protein [Dactylosporangium fulvum]UWP85943.1 hypothetical protein Dfulv_17490 [Dactylosporangium fulvum]